MSRNYEPDNQFLERLEWQMASEYRRTNRLKSSPKKVSMSRRMLAVSLIVGTFMTGVAMIKATEVIRDSWKKKIEIARIETEVKLKEVRLGSIREIVSRQEIEYATGLLLEEEYQMMQIVLEKAGQDLHNSQLNLEEVRASGKVPRNELYAPVVRGRDFVSERLIFEMNNIELELGQYKNHFAKLKQKVDVGLVHKSELDFLQSVIDAQSVKIENIQNKLDLRSRFVVGEITAQEIEIKERMTVAERNLYMAQSKVEFIHKAINQLEDRVDVGVVSQTELTQIQYALNAAQAELDLAKLELDVLDKIQVKVRF